MQALRRMVLAELDARWPAPEDAPTSSDWLPEAVAYLNDRARRRFEGWLSTPLGETWSLLVELAATELDELYSMRESVDGLGAASFGVPLRDPPRTPAWSPADLPQLATRQVALRINAPRSWGLGARSRRDIDGRRRVLEAVDAALVTCAEDVRSELVRAAGHWVEHVTSAIEHETCVGAERLAANARNPGTEEQCARLEAFEQDLVTFRSQLADWKPPPPSTQHEFSPAAAKEPAPECAICQQLADVPFLFMARAQWTLARQAERRSAHIQVGGFCPMHTWQYAEIASELGIALAYAPVAQSAAELIAREQGDGLPAAIAKLMPGPERCPACVDLARAEHAAVDQLVTSVPTPFDGATAPCLCVPHLAAVLAADPGEEATQWLFERLAATLNRAAEDLRTYALKREAMRAYLVNDDEGAASAVVISHLVGSRGLVRPWRRNDEIG